MVYSKLTPHTTPDARVEEISSGSAYRLSISSGKADKYRCAQLDDYTLLSRRRFPHRSGLSLSLTARISSDSIPGTWGFGLWNDPFGFSLGFGGNPLRLPALPNAVWFFGASEDNYLSFKDPRAEQESKTEREVRSANRLASSLRPAQGEVANGFLAQIFRAPKFHPLLVPAGLVFPFSRRATRQLFGRIIGEGGVGLSLDVTQWHGYKLEWRETRVAFEVDGELVLESPVSPHPPLGLVIWIDNQFAAFTPEGKIGFGVLENPEPAWLEIKGLEIGQNDQKVGR